MKSSRPAYDPALLDGAAGGLDVPCELVLNVAVWGVEQVISRRLSVSVCSQRLCPKEPSVHFGVTVVALVFLIDAGWYAIVATALSAVAPRNAHLPYKTWIGRSAGAIMGVLWVKLTSSAGSQ